MRIAVLSDTHLPWPDDRLADLYDRHLAPADAVIHCGDLTGWEVWDFLNRHPRFHAVSGNVCDRDLADLLPWRLELDLDGLRVGVTHGHAVGLPVARGAAELFGTGFDLVCFGHTHAFYWAECGGVPVLNPGAVRHPRVDAPSLALVDWTPGQPLAVERVLLHGEAPFRLGPTANAS